MLQKSIDYKEKEKNNMSISERTYMKELSQYLEGVADMCMIQGNEEMSIKMSKAAKFLFRASNNICGQGFFGCHGGEKCDSDHK